MPTTHSGAGCSWAAAAPSAHKLYVDRQCHFQHYAQPNGVPHTCRRPKAGESSADHLYVKSAMSQSLLEHGRAGRFAFPPPIGSLLDVDLEDGVSLRLHMDDSVPRDWAGGRTVVLGPGVVPDLGVLSSCRYVYRVRCERDGASRRVWIGTQSLAHPTEWVPISDCTAPNGGHAAPQWAMRRSGVSAVEQRKLVAELDTAVRTAGDWLSARERRDAYSWIRKPPASEKPAHGRQARREFAPDVLESAAAAVRGALKKAAREQITTNWARLEQQLGSALPRMTLADRIQVMILVDQATPADQALLSSLVAAGDPDMTTSYRKVAGALGLDLPDDDDDLRDVLEADMQQVHYHWRHQ